MSRKLIIFAVICFCILSLAANVYSAENPTRYINDLPWAYEITHNWEITPMEGCVIPHTAFERISGIDVAFNRNHTQMTMTKGEKKIVVDLKTKDYMIIGDRQIYVKIYEFRTGVYWLPAETVCNYFGLTLDIYQYGKSTKESAIRISDSTAAKSLNELLTLYNPDLAEKEEKLPIETTKEEPEPPIGDRLILFTFEGELNAETVNILDILAEHDVKAAFFIVGASLTDNMEILRRLIVDGHTIGLHTMTHNETAYINNMNVIFDEFNEENELLYKLTKQKTRLCRAPNGSSSGKFFIDNEFGKQLYNSGYIVWDWNINMAGMTYENAVNGIKRNEIPVLRFEMDESAVRLLPEILDYIAENEQFKIKQITESTEEVNFIGKFN